MEKYDFILSLVDLIGFWLVHIVAAIKEPIEAMQNAQVKTEGASYESTYDDNGEPIKMATIDP